MIGMKEKKIIMSLPSRGAWIEIIMVGAALPKTRCRSPRGERGLKYREEAAHKDESGSLPSRGAWIEIYLFFRLTAFSLVAPLAGSVD